MAQIISGVPTFGGGGGGTPGTPALSIQGANADGTAFVGIPNSSFDASTGDATLGAGLTVNGPAGDPFFNVIGSKSLAEFDSTNPDGAGTGTAVFVNDIEIDNSGSGRKS